MCRRCPSVHLIVLVRDRLAVAISLVQFGLPALFFALRDEFGMGTVEFGLLFAAIGVGPAVALIAAGRLCDRLGARPVLVAGSLIGAAGLAAAGFAPTIPAAVRRRCSSPASAAPPCRSPG